MEKNFVTNNFAVAVNVEFVDDLYNSNICTYSLYPIIECNGNKYVVSLHKPLHSKSFEFDKDDEWKSLLKDRIETVNSIKTPNGDTMVFWKGEPIYSIHRSKKSTEICLTCYGNGGAGSIILDPVSASADGGVGTCVNFLSRSKKEYRYNVSVLEYETL